MFNLVMGIIMVFAGVISVAKGVMSSAGSASMAAFIFLGVMLFVFGIVEIIRSTQIRKKKKANKNKELDAYLQMASEMGVVVNPITHEIVHAKKSDEDTDEKDDDNSGEDSDEDSGEQTTDASQD